MTFTNKTSFDQIESLKDIGESLLMLLLDNNCRPHREELKKMKRENINDQTGLFVKTFYFAEFFAVFTIGNH